MTGRQYPARDCKLPRSEVDDIELRRRLIFAEKDFKVTYKTFSKLSENEPCTFTRKHLTKDKCLKIFIVLLLKHF